METKDINNELPRIFKVFAGMNDAYVNLVRLYHAVAKTDRYTPDYKKECRLNTVQAIQTLKQEYVVSANKIIQQIKDEYSEQPPVVEEPKTEQAMLLKEIQRSNNLTLWRQQMEFASVTDLRAMYQENKWDKDFRAMLDVELRKRGNQPEANIFKLELENPPEDRIFKRINEIQKGLNSLVSMQYYPQSLAENGLDDLKLRNFSQDLDVVMDSPAFHL